MKNQQARRKMFPSGRGLTSDLKFVVGGGGGWGLKRLFSKYVFIVFGKLGGGS